MSARSGASALLLAGGMLALEASAATAPTWVARYDGPSHGEDRPAAIVADPAGNAYITGFSRGDRGYDVVTIRHDPRGRIAWVERFDGPAGGLDEGVALALDPSGALYVGGTTSTARGTDFLVLRYDADSGALEWSAIFDASPGECGEDGPRCSDDRLRGIALDGAGGIVLTGDGGASDRTGKSIVTVHFDAAGRQRWAARTEPLPGGNDAATDVVVAPCDRVYVTGRSRGERQFDILTLSYALSSGRLRWTRRVDGPVGGFDGGVALGVDREGALYEVASSYGEGWRRAALITKRTPQGNTRWTYRHDTDGAPQRVIGARVGAGGRVHVLGSVRAGQRWETMVFEVDAHGALRWETRLAARRPGDVLARGLDPDAAGDLLVTAVVGVGQSLRCDLCPDYGVWRLDGTTGAARWQTIFDGEAADTDVPLGIAASGASGVVVTGMSPAIGALSPIGGRVSDVVSAGFAGASGGALTPEQSDDRACEG